MRWKLHLEAQTALPSRVDQELGGQCWISGAGRGVWLGSVQPCLPSAALTQGFCRAQRAMPGSGPGMLY